MTKTKIIIIVFILLSVVIIAVDTALRFIPPISNTPDLCLVLDPSYLLLCQDKDMMNESIAVVSSYENLNISLEKNNCSVVERQDSIDIKYCYENATFKYKINLENYPS